MSCSPSSRCFSLIAAQSSQPFVNIPARYDTSINPAYDPSLPDAAPPLKHQPFVPPPP